MPVRSGAPILTRRTRRTEAGSARGRGAEILSSSPRVSEAG